MSYEIRHPYVDVQVPIPSMGDYRNLLREYMPGFSGIPDAQGVIGGLAQQAFAAMGPAAVMGPAVSAVVAAGGFVYSVFSALFGKSDPIVVQKVGGFPADIMQTTPLKDSNTAVAAAALTFNGSEGRGLVRESVRSSALNTLSLAIDGYGRGGWHGLEDNLGDEASKRTCALFLAATNYKWLLGTDIGVRIRTEKVAEECIGELLAYGTPRLQVRRIAFYQSLAENGTSSRLAHIGGHIGNWQILARAIGAAGGRDAFVSAAQSLAIPVPMPRGNDTIWTFNAIRPEIVSAEMSWYAADSKRKIKEALDKSGELFTVEPSGSLIQSAVSAALDNRGYMSRVENMLDAMDESRKMQLAGKIKSGMALKSAMAKLRDGTTAPKTAVKGVTYSGPKLSAHDVKTRARIDGRSNAPLIAAGVVAAGLGAMYLWNKRR